MYRAMGAAAKKRPEDALNTFGQTRNRQTSGKPAGAAQRSAVHRFPVRRFAGSRTGISRQPVRHRIKMMVYGLALAAAAGALLWEPNRSTAAALVGLEVCAQVIIPSLFPFFVLSSLAVNLGLAGALGRATDRLSEPVFGAWGGAPAFCLGLLGGYPSGARAVREMFDRGELSRPDAEKLLASCNNCGPAFVLGVAGAGVFQSGRIGVLLYAVHVGSALICALVFRGSQHRDPGQAGAQHRTRQVIKAMSPSAALASAVSSALSATLAICAYVVFFTLAAELCPLPRGVSGAALAGLMEVSTGVQMLRALEPQRAAAAVCAAIIGWGGLCVHAQTLSFISGLRKKRYFLGKALQGALSLALMWIFFPLAV